MYKACIFDLDGTLTNTLDSLTYSETQSLRGLKKVWKCTAESLEKIVCTMYVLMMALFRC